MVFLKRINYNWSEFKNDKYNASGKGKIMLIKINKKYLLGIV